MPVTPDADAALPADFERAVAQSKSLSQRPEPQTLLSLYALYKQATDGDVDSPRPGALAMVERAKWDARKALAGLPAADAMRRYIDLVEELKG